MNKRVIITISVAVVLIVGAFIGTVEYLSYKDVSLTFTKPNVAVTIYNANGASVGTFSNDTTTKLKEGKYTYAATSDNYSTNKVAFEVSSDQRTVEISPAYSGAFLAELLTEEQKEIQGALTSKHPEIKTNYIIGDEHLAHLGEWYSAKLIQRVSGANEPDVYRVVLKKEDGVWKVIATPKLTLSIAENSSVPEYVIRQVNEPLSSEAYALLYPE